MLSNKIEPIRALETQSGLARLPLSLYLEGPGSMSCMIGTSNLYPNVGHAAARKATESGLTNTDLDPNATHRTRKLQLTRKGRLVAKRPVDINPSRSGM